MAQTTYVQSGARTDGSFSPVNVMEIGGSSQPTDLIIYNGRIYAYNEEGQATIQDGVVQAAGIATRAISAEKISTNQRPFIHNIGFDAPTRNKVTWLAGSIYFAGGEEVPIAAGSTGNLSQPVYIYYDSGNELKTTTNIAVATAGNSAPIMKVIPQDAEDDRALMQDIRGLSTTISGNQITTGKISADRIHVGLVNFITDVSFQPESADNLSWESGDLELATGAVHSISSGSTGNLAKRTTAPTSDGNTVAVYNMEDTGSTIDNGEGTASLDGTATGTTEYEDGRFGKCRFFNGSGDYIEVSDNAALDLIDFTIEVSFNYSQSEDEAEHVIIGRENTTSTSWPYRVLINEEGYLQFDIRPNSSVVYTLVSQVEMNDGVWHDVRGTFDSTTNTMELWIDNIKHAAKTDCFTDPQASAEPLMIGRSNASGGTKYFRGYIDAIRLSSSIRTSSTPAQRYIYWDGTPYLKVTTSQSDTVGTSKLVMAIMTPKSAYGSCEVQIFGNRGTIISGDQIQTGRISSADNKTYFDLNERKIVMNDGNTDRLILGYAPGLF